jgi:hypothetical protein
VSSKLDVLNYLIAKVDVLVIGGAMANTMLFAQGKAVGKSLCERDLAATARGILDKAAQSKCRVVLPVDAVVAHELKAQVASETVAVDRIPDEAMILDVGPATVTAIGGEPPRAVRWCGTVRSAPSRRRPSMPAPSRSRALSPLSPNRVSCSASPVAATPSRRLPMPVWSTN